MQGLSVRFGKREILRGLTATLRGRAIGLLGPNGAGKSTLINTLLGFYKSSAGSARVFGYDVGTEVRKIRGLVGYMPENDAFISKMSAVSFVQMMGELSGLPSEHGAGTSARGAVLRGIGGGALPEAGNVFAGHEATGEAGAGDRARTEAADSRRADQRAGSFGAADG